MLEELRQAEANLRSSDDLAALEEKAALVDRLEEELASRDTALADKEREIATAAARIASLEGTEDDSEPAAAAAAESSPDYVPPRQNPTGPGALTDVIEFEVGGAD